MSLWGSTSGGTTPKFVTRNSNTYVTNINGTANNFVVTGITAAGASANHATHNGWVAVMTGTGPVKSLSITAGGTLYTNADAVVFTGANTAPATASITTNANGTITTITLTSGGSGYTAAPTVAVTSANGTGAVITAVAGGRAGRVLRNCLVALPSMTT
jgi:hypothetical protein